MPRNEENPRISIYVKDEMVLRFLKEAKEFKKQNPSTKKPDLFNQTKIWRELVRCSKESLEVIGKFGVEEYIEHLKAQNRELTRCKEESLEVIGKNSVEEYIEHLKAQIREKEEMIFTLIKSNGGVSRKENKADDKQVASDLEKISIVDEKEDGSKTKKLDFKEETSKKDDSLEKSDLSTSVVDVKKNDKDEAIAQKKNTTEEKKRKFKDVYATENFVKG